MIKDSLAIEEFISFLDVINKHYSEIDSRDISHAIGAIEVILNQLEDIENEN